LSRARPLQAARRGLRAAVSPILRRVLIDPLNAAAIERALAAHAAAGHAPRLAVRVVDACASTNALLLAEPSGPDAVLLAAELQTAGRGRRGRRWMSPRGAGLTFSLRRELACSLRRSAGLPLAAGVAAARALRALGADGVALKWPNDLMARGAKLGGVLIETRPAGGGTLAVIGIGLNCRAQPRAAARLGRAVIALEELLAPLPSRNLIAARLARELLAVLARFEAGGLEAVREDWEALHADAGQRLRLRLADGRQVTGVAAGLAPDGGLRLRTRGGLRSIPGASVRSARLA
jgi:BirA family transcriptional regulator, biotin operon repressor / biotin---[acetyl-CoA-carboxylase] ligase